MECIRGLCVLAAVCAVLIQHSTQAPMPQSADEMYKGVRQYLEKHSGEGVKEALEILRERMEKDGKASLDELSDEQKKDLVEHYIEEVVSHNVLEPYGSQRILESMKDMMQEYLEYHRTQTEAANAGARAGLMSIANQFLQGADTDLLKDLMRIYARNTMRAQLPLSPERKMLYALMNQASMYPGDMQLTEMLDNALRKAEGMDKAFLGLVFTNMMNRPGASDEQREMAMYCLQVLIEDGDFVSQYPKKVMDMWLQQFVDHHKNKMKTRDLIAFWVANALQDLHDEESSKMAATIVFHVMTHTVVEDMPEEDHWKWLPPTICSMQNSDMVIGSHPCPENLQCAVGPTDVTVNDTDYTIRLCSVPTNYQLFHACQVMFTNGTMVHEDYHCPREECTVGPVRVQWNAYDHGVNVDLDVNYCTSLPNNYHKEHTIVDRACAVTNTKFKTLMQRECPMDYMCSLGPFPIDGQDDHNAWLCTEMPDNDDDFMTEIINIFLGNDLMEEADHLPRNASEADRDFLEFVVQHITENSGKENDDDKPDPDTIGLMILHHFVEEMKDTTGSAGLIGKVYETLHYVKEKHGMDFGDMDRKPMHFIIMYLVDQHKAEEQQRQEAPLRDLLQAHLDMHQDGGDSSSSEERSSESAEKRGGADNADMLVKLLMMLSGQSGQDEETQSESYSESASDSGSQEQGGNQGELLRGVTELLLHHGAAHGKLHERQDHHANLIQDLMEMLKSGSSEGTSEEESESNEESDENSDEGSDEEMKEMLMRMLGEGSK